MNLAIIMMSFFWGCGGSEQPEVQKEPSAVKEAPVKTNENVKPSPPGGVKTPPKSLDEEIEDATKEMDKAMEDASKEMDKALQEMNQEIDKAIQDIVEDPTLQNIIKANPTNDPDVQELIDLNKCIEGCGKYSDPQKSLDCMNECAEE